MAGTVTVASKLPFPLSLQLQRKMERHEDVIGAAHSVTTRAVPVYVKDGRTVVIAGCAVDRGKPSETHLIGGFALTYNVDADFWKAWVAQHEDFPPYAQGLIFATEKGGTESEARNRRAQRSGFEPLDPEAPPAEFQGRDKVTPLKAS